MDSDGVARRRTTRGKGRARLQAKALARAVYSTTRLLDYCNRSRCWALYIPEVIHHAIPRPTVIPAIASAILATLELPENHSTDMKQYRRKALSCQCRELEKFLKLRKSVAAQELADKLGIGDLAQYAWIDQKKQGKMGDLERAIFHFEHTVPVAVIARRLLALNPPTLERIQQIISMAEVSWITKAENERLDKLKLRHKRDDPIAAYAEAKIVLCAE